jgi:hypothetical protein
MNDLWKKWMPYNVYNFHDNSNIHLDGSNLILTTSQHSIYSTGPNFPFTNAKGANIMAKDSNGLDLKFHFGNRFSMPPNTNPYIYDNKIEGGYFEIRCKMPHYSINNEYNAAFWLFGTDELDIFEYEHNEEFTNNYHALGNYNPPHGGYSYACQDKYLNYKNPTLSEDFHTYGVMWEIDQKSPLVDSKIRVTYFMDGKELRTIDYMPNDQINNGNYFVNSNSPFLSLIIGFAPIVPEYLGTVEVLKESFVSEVKDALTIDYVKVYKKRRNEPTKKPISFKIQTDYDVTKSGISIAAGPGNRVFFRDSNNFIRAFSWKNFPVSNNYFEYQISGNPNSALVAGDIQYFDDPIFVRNDGTLGYLHWDQISNSYFNWSFNGFSNYPITQNVSTMHNSFKKGKSDIILYYRNTSNELIRLLWIGAWTSLSLTGNVGGSIAMDEIDPNKSDVVIYHGTDGKLWIYDYTNQVNTHIDPLGVFADSTFNVKGDIYYGNNQIIYHGIDDRIQCYYWTGTYWAHTYISTNNSPNVKGRMKVLPKTYVELHNTNASPPNYSNSPGDIFYAHNYNNIIYYRGSDNLIHCLYFEFGQWNDIVDKVNCNNCNVSDDFVISENNQIIYTSTTAIETDFMKVFGCEILNRPCKSSNLSSGNPSFYVGSFSTNPNIVLKSMNIDSTKKEIMDLKLYPNPSVNMVYINEINKAYLYDIFSLDGKLVISGSTREGKEGINIGLLNQGVYFLRISTESGNQTFMFNKQ